MSTWLPFEWIAAVRFLREGRMQSLLIIVGVGVGVAVIVFMSALLSGLQDNLIKRTLSSQPHITLLPVEEVARPHQASAANTALRLQKNAQRGSVEIRLAVPQAPAYLRHDMTVSIDIEAAQRPDALSVPCDSLRDIAGMPWVMAVRDNRTVRQAVRLGLRGSGRCEVVDGLKAGEAVLVAGDQVSEGRRVTTVERK